MIEPLDLLQHLPGLLARVTVLLGLATGLTWAFRSRAASTRHLLWTTSFLLLIGLPAAMHWLPSLELQILPGSPPPTAAEAAPSTTGVDPSGSHDFAVGILTNGLLLFLWAAGTFAAMLSLVAGGLRFCRWVERGRPIRDPEWIDDLDQLRARLGIRRRVRLVRSPEVTTPMVGGWLKPVVLLPMSASRWTKARRWAVLAHELVHVRRHDPIRQAMVSVALAFYWFHPLSWTAVRLATGAREQACDEGVLELGARPSEYASHLLNLATQSTRPRSALALPMVQRTHLERRISAILDPQRPRPNLPIAAALCGLLLVCGMTTTVAEPVVPGTRPTCEYTNPIPSTP